MLTKWDRRFDSLVGADIQDQDTEPCLDSELHDLLYGEAEIILKSIMVGCTTDADFGKTHDLRVGGFLAFRSERPLFAVLLSEYTRVRSDTESLLDSGSVLRLLTTPRRQKRPAQHPLRWSIQG